MFCDAPDSDKPAACQRTDHVVSGQSVLTITAHSAGLHSLHVRYNDVNIPGKVVDRLVIAISTSARLSVCLFSRLSHKLHVQTSRNFPTCELQPWLGPPSRQYDTLCTSGFLDDVMFSHYGPLGAWRWQYRRGRRATSSCHKFRRICQGAPRCLSACILDKISKS